MMKKTWFITCLSFLSLTLFSCGGSSNDSAAAADRPKPKSMIEEPPADDGKGIGEVKEVQLNDPLDETMVAAGQAIYDLKCSACHKLTDQRVVGPGWKGVTQRRKPEWIMNMIMNVDVMLEQDPTAQKLLEECLTRMPNQNMTQDDARHVLEFMYSNDKK